MQPKQQTYKAMIWATPSSVGKRVTVIAESLDDARLKLEREYGEGTVFDLHNEIDASTPR
jgi:phage gp46-like protein